MNNIYISWKAIFEFLGGATVIIFAAMGFFKFLFSEWMKNRWNKSANKEIENLKGQISQYNSSLNSITSAYLNNYQKVQEKRINATESIWRVILNIRNSIPDEIGLLIRTKTESEIIELASKEIVTDRHIAKIITFNLVDFHTNIVESSRDLEQHKPFLGDTMYTYYEVYVSIIYQYVHNMVRGFQSRNLELWLLEPAFVSMAKILATDQELEVIKQNNRNTFILFTIVAERKILGELRKNINGTDLSSDTIEQ